MLKTLTIAIATMGNRVHQIKIPDAREGVRYFVGIQKPEGVPAHLEAREDVHVELLETIGLSRSRNAALEACDTDLILIADDDLQFIENGIDDMRRAFSENTGLVIATGRLEDPDGGLFKSYPDKIKPLKPGNSGFVGSPEVMIRMSFIKSTHLRFDERFGLGSIYPTGEEYIFITDAMKRGGKVSFLPHTVAVHPKISTGNNWSNPDLIFARSKVLSRTWGALSPVVRLAYALRKRKLLGLRGAAQFALGMKIRS